MWKWLRSKWDGWRTKEQRKRTPRTLGGLSFESRLRIEAEPEPSKPKQRIITRPKR